MRGRKGSEHITKPFARTDFTWLAYLMLAYFAYLEASFGPVMPFVSMELHLSYTIGSLHVSAFALGVILAGLFGDRLAHRWGRRLVFWGGAVGMAVGAALFTLGHQVVLTISSAFLMGVFGSLLLVMIQATLSDQHGEQRTVALTEANVIASIGAGLAPVLIGGFQNVGASWRGAIFVAIALFVLIAVRWWRVAVPETQEDEPEKGSVTRRRLPLAFWVYWAALVCCVSIEWCVVVWSADFLKEVGRLSSSVAATTVGLFFLAEVVGRLAGSRLSRVVRGTTLLLIALAITTAGFPLFWLSPVTPLSIAGLFIAGLGIANLFPLTLAVAIGVAPRQADAASARLSFAGGFAIFTAPLVLGWVADSIGIQHAFGLVIFLLIGAIGMTLLANRLAPGRKKI